MPISLNKLPKPKFTEEQQAKNPDAKMTRVIKDFLKVGNWTCGTNLGHAEDWDITHEQLTLAAKTFATLRENGHKPKLYWGNFRSDANSQHEVATQDEIAEIDQVIVDGDEAYLLAYVSPAEAKRLANSSLEVSPAIAEQWTDSKKNVYSNAIMHVAIVDHPVILGQGKFLTLSADGLKGTATRVLTLSNEQPSSEGSENMTLFEKLKAKFGFGDDVTADNIDAMIEAKIKASGTPTKVDPVASPELKQLAALVKEQGETIRILSADHKRLIDKEVASNKTAYENELTRLLSAETITRAFHDHYLSLGKKHGYDFEILKGLPLIKTLASAKSNTLELAMPNEPDVGGGETDAQRDARLKAAGYEPLRVISA